MRRLLLLGALVFALSAFASMPVSAASLKMAPLMYQDSLKPGESKQGFVDISNPTGATLQLRTSVRAFKQTDDSGSLTFYDNPAVTAGLKPDLETFELGPRQAFRLYFTLDGTKLPSGDVFAALFVTTEPNTASGVAEVVQLGTLFVLENGTTPSHEAAITALDVPFFQFGEGVSGSYTVKNTSPTDQTGFFPSVSLSLNPFSSTTQTKATLLFAGRERSNDFSLDTPRLGFYQLSVRTGDSTKSQWVFMATGFWRPVALIGGLLLLLGAGFVWWRRARADRRQTYIKFD